MRDLLRCQLQRRRPRRAFVSPSHLPLHQRRLARCYRPRLRCVLLRKRRRPPAPAPILTSLVSPANLARLILGFFFYRTLRMGRLTVPMCRRTPSNRAGLIRNSLCDTPAVTGGASPRCSLFDFSSCGFSAVAVPSGTLFVPSSLLCSIFFCVLCRPIGRPSCNQSFLLSLSLRHCRPHVLAGTRRVRNFLQAVPPVTVHL